MKKLSKLLFSLFFAISFLTFTIAPALMIIMNDNFEIIQVYNTAEEEEKKDEKKFENDLVFSCQSNQNKSVNGKSIVVRLGYEYLKYPKPHLNLVFPPPEHC